MFIQSTTLAPTLRSGPPLLQKEGKFKELKYRVNYGTNYVIIYISINQSNARLNLCI
jgi:hypothetical protein